MKQKRKRYDRKKSMDKLEIECLGCKEGDPILFYSYDCRVNFLICPICKLVYIKTTDFEHQHYEKAVKCISDRVLILNEKYRKRAMDLAKNRNETLTDLIFSLIDKETGRQEL